MKKAVRVFTIGRDVLFHDVMSYTMSEVNNALYIKDSNHRCHKALFNKELVFGVVEEERHIPNGASYAFSGYKVFKSPTFSDESDNLYYVFIEACTYEYDVTKKEIIFYDDKDFRSRVGIFNMNNVLYVERVD